MVGREGKAAKGRGQRQAGWGSVAQETGENSSPATHIKRRISGGPDWAAGSWVALRGAVSLRLRGRS